MRWGWSVALVLGAMTSVALAQTAARPPLAGLLFLVGDWTAGRGTVADTGGASTGRSRFTLEAGGAVLLRRDHTDLLNPAGKPAGGFDQIMMIYPEAGTLHADYADGSHVIHYTSAKIEPGRAVTFTSARQPGAPTFRLSYRLTGPTTLAVAFAMSPPGSDAFRPIATGSLTRAAAP